MSTGRETFHKTERLCSRKIINALFENGNIIHTSYFKAIWLISPLCLPSAAQVAFSVSKRTFRKAVTRNLIKRKMREAYRRTKHYLYDFLDAESTRITFIIIFRRNEEVDYQIIENSMKELLDKLTFQIKEYQTKS
jgi:ribonuclease P protein component